MRPLECWHTRDFSMYHDPKNYRSGPSVDSLGPLILGVVLFGFLLSGGAVVALILFFRSSFFYAEQTAPKAGPPTDVLTPPMAHVEPPRFVAPPRYGPSVAAEPFMPQPRSSMPGVPSSTYAPNGPPYAPPPDAPPGAFPPAELPPAESPPARPLDPPATRTWTDNTGSYSVDAKFVRHEGGKVFLEKPDGSPLAIEMSRLSQTDQDYVIARMR